MATGSYKKLLAWSQDHGYELAVQKGALAGGSLEWSLAISIDDPVEFDATGTGADIDDAADRVLADLKTVGAEVE